MVIEAVVLGAILMVPLLIWAIPEARKEFSEGKKLRGASAK